MLAQYKKRRSVGLEVFVVCIEFVTSFDQIHLKSVGALYSEMNTV